MAGTKKLSELVRRAIGENGSIIITQEENGQVVSARTTVPELVEALEAAGISSGAAFDELAFEDGFLHIKNEGTDVVDPVYIGGGGGSDFGSVLRIQNKLPSRSFTVLSTAQTCPIAYAVTSVDSEDQTPTGNIGVEWFINGTRRAAFTVAQGDNSFDVRQYLSTGANTIKLTATDSYGNSKSMTWNVTMTAFGVSWNLAPLAIDGSDDLIARIVVSGAGDKTLNVTVDGTSVYTGTITTDGRTTTVTIPAQAHGSHIVRAWATMEQDGETIRTDTLKHTGIWTESGNSNAIVAMENTEITAAQYATTAIRYLVYDPSSETAAVSLAVNGRVATSVTADRTVQTWNYKASVQGTHTMAAICTNAMGTASLTVTASEYDISPVTGGLILDLDPAGHSNTEVNRASFGYTDGNGDNHPLTFSSNFDWAGGGFQTDGDGVTAFVVKRGTTVTLDRSFFDFNAKVNGSELKIVFKVTNARDYDATFLSCSSGAGLVMRAQNAVLSSELASMAAQYCEDKKIEMDINIEAASDNKLAMMWLEGVPSRVIQYTDGDSWVQATPQNVVIGSADCDVWIYRIKQYGLSLTRDEINRNYTADCSDTDEMIARYERNEIFNADGTININKLAAANPTLRVIHISAPRMTTSKDDEVIANAEIIYTAGGEEHHLIAQGVTIKAQGTSSLEYILAALNLDVDFSTATSWVNGSGETVTAYAMTENSIPVAYFNVKADVASSEKANNVVLADRYNTYQPFITEERAADSRVLDTIEGHPCVVFFTSTATEDIQVGARTVSPGETIMYFVGNMNNSKKNFAVFGQTSTRAMQCCVEIGNNNNPQCLFQSDDLTAEDWTGKNGSNFEFRYPKKPTQAMKDAFQEMLSWVVSTDPTAATGDALDQIVTIDGIIYTTDTADYRRAKFRSEVGDYFTVDSLTYHYLFTERHLMVDNRAKNTFVSYDWDSDAEGMRWNFNKDYDNDTADGNDNSGGLTFTYGMEDTDTVGASFVFNAHDSVLWCNVRDCLASELRSMYIDRENAGAWDAAAILAQFKAHQAAIPEALATEDMYAKYVAAAIDGGAARFLGMMLGTKEDQRRQFETYQEMYIASKYRGSKVTGTDRLSFRLNAPEEWTGVRPSGNIIGVVPYADMYLRAQFGNAGEYSVRAKRGQTYTLECPPAARLNDLETYVYGASGIAHLGSLAALYTKFADVAAATRLQEFLLGSDASGYENTGITGNVTVGNNRLVEVIDLRGTPNLEIPLDLSGLSSLREIYAADSGITGVTFADGAPLETAYLPGIRRLVAKNLTKVSTFACSGASLTAIRIEDCPAIDTAALCAAASGLERGRLTGVSWVLASAELPLHLATLGGFDATGTEISNFALTGSCYISTISQAELDALEAAFPGLTITYGDMVPDYTVRFLNYDGTVLHTQTVRQFGAAVNPVTSGDIPTPTREASVETIYTFIGWDSAFDYILTDTDVTAMYSESDRTYCVTWWLENDRITKLYELTGIEAHAAAAYGGSTPTDSGKLWIGWSDATNEIVSDMDIVAEFLTPTLPDTIPETYDYLYSDDPNDDSAYTLAEFYGIINSRRGKDYFSYGDRIKIVPPVGTTAFADSSIILQLEAFNHFKLADGSGTFAHTHFGMIGTMNATRAMRGTNDNTGGWPATSMRTWLNGTLYNALPQKWRSMMKLVEVISTEGETKDTTVVSNDHVYLRSYREVGFGSSVPYGYEVDADAEDKAFGVYNSNASRIKAPYNNTGTAVFWWLRSPIASSSAIFASVINNGYAYSNNATSSNGVSFGFSI